MWIKNLGHKPDWVAPELVAGAVEKVAGNGVDLRAIARQVEGRIAGQGFGPIERCRDGKAMIGAQTDGWFQSSSRTQIPPRPSEPMYAMRSMLVAPGVLSGTPAVMMIRSPGRPNCSS